MVPKWTAVLAAVGILVLTSPGRAQDVSPEFERDVRTLMDFIESPEIIDRTVSTLMPLAVQPFRKAMPDAPEAMFAMLEDEMEAIIHEAIVQSRDNDAELVANHFTHAEVRQLIAFYRTDVGRKLVAKLPEIAKEREAWVAKWFAEHGEAAVLSAAKRVFDRFKERGG